VELTTACALPSPASPTGGAGAMSRCTTTDGGEPCGGGVMPCEAAMAAIGSAGGGAGDTEGVGEASASRRSSPSLLASSPLPRDCRRRCLTAAADSAAGRHATTRALLPTDGGVATCGSGTAAIGAGAVVTVEVVLAAATVRAAEAADERDGAGEGGVRRARRSEGAPSSVSAKVSSVHRGIGEREGGGRGTKAAKAQQIWWRTHAAAAKFEDPVYPNRL